jgi:type I restriction enzyme S subunit
MSYLKELIDGAHVEWKTLGSITNVLRGRRLTRKLLSKKEKYPVFHGGLEPMGFYSMNNRKADTVMIINVGASAGTVGYSDVDFWSSDGSYCIEHNCKIDNKFLYYFLIGEEYFLKSRVRKAGIPTLDAFVIEKLEIPIPCPDNPKKSLKIQKEIVRVLDTFAELTTELTLELTTELTARKKQYSYYREQLLTFEGIEVEWKPLSEIAEYSKKRIGFEKLDETNYVGVDNLLQNREGKKKSTRVPTKGNSTKYEVNDVLIGNIRPYLKKIWLSDCVGGTNGDVLVIHLTDESVASNFLYQILADDKFFEYNMKFSKGAKMPRGNKTKIMDYLIPVPSPEEQKRIVSILDKIDTLTTSISEDLLKEIDLRKKQYEYYRNKLLTFPKDNIKV